MGQRWPARGEIENDYEHQSSRCGRPSSPAGFVTSMRAMTQPALRSLVLSSVAALAIGCGSATPAGEQPRSAADPCPEQGAPASAEGTATDPDILALAEAAKRCPFESGSFDWNCKAYKEWKQDNDDIFEGPSANATILAMLEDADVRTRTLATDRGFVGAKAFFADVGRAKRLLAVVQKERETRFLSSYGRFVAFINGEKILGTELRALAKEQPTELRRAYAENVLPQNPTAFSLELVDGFLKDADQSVQRAAVRSLSASGRTRPTEAICSTLKKQMERTDKLAGDALDAGATSKCPGLAPLVVAQVQKLSADPTKLNERDAPDLASSLSTLCWRDSAPELKTQAFDVAVKIAPKITEDWTKRSYLRLFRSCDLKRAKAALQPYLKEKETAETAKEEIESVDREIAQNQQ